MSARDQGPRKSLAANLRHCAVWGLLLVAFALRVYALGRQELSFDEVASFFIANRGPFQLLAYVRSAVREHPPLYYLLLSLWMPLAGRSEFAIRFLSVIIGTATVAVTYRTLKRVSHQWLALLSTLLLVASPFHIQTSRDARMYGLLVLWTVLSIRAFVVLLEHLPERSPVSTSRSSGLLPAGMARRWTAEANGLAKWAVFWLVTGLGMFTHYFMIFVLLAEDLYLLLKWRRYKGLLLPWLAVHAALGGAVVLWAVTSPGLWATLVSLWDRGTASTVRWQALARGLNGLYLGATARPNWSHLGLCLVVTALGLLPVQWREPTASRGPGRDRLLSVCLLGAPIVAVLALPERVSGRYLTPAFPPVILAMARGLGVPFVFLRHRLHGLRGTRLRLFVASLLPLALLSGILFVDIQTYDSLYIPPEQSFRDRTEYLNEHARPGDGLLLHGPWQQLLLSYYDLSALKTYTIPLRDLQVDRERVDPTLRRVLEAHERLWVSYDAVDPVDPEWVVSRWLHEHAHQVLDYRGLTLYCRPRTQDSPTESRAEPSESSASAGNDHDQQAPLEGEDVYDRVTQPEISFGERLQLEDAALSNLNLTSGEAVLLLSRWRVLRNISPGLIFRLELVGPDSRVWEEYAFKTKPAHVAPQGWADGDILIERRGLVVPIGTPPGEYRLRLRVLSPAGEEWLPESGDPFDVGTVRVEHHAPSSQEIEGLPGRELRADFEGTISLIGYAPWGRNFTQGNPLLFDIYWQALDTPVEDYTLEIAVVQNRGSMLTQKKVQPVADWCPTSTWKAQDVLKGHYVVPLPVDAPPGPYQIRLSLVAPDGSPLSMEGRRTHRILDWWDREETLSGTDLVLFDGIIDPRPRQYQAPPMDHRVNVVLSNDEGQEKIRLLGYDLASVPVEPGRSFEVTLYWKTLSRTDRIYAVFNHLVASDGTLQAQQDGWPRQGMHHTSQWLPGEVVEDHYTIQVPLDTPPGEYALRVGMYDADTKERLLVAVDGQPVPDRHAALTKVTVAK